MKLLFTIILVSISVLGNTQLDTSNVRKDSGEVNIRATLQWLLNHYNEAVAILNGKQDALGFTPYNATNPSGYISGINSSAVTTALGFTPYNATNPNGYITGIADGSVTYAKIQNITADRLLGRSNAGNGVMQEILLGTGLSYTDNTLNVSSAPSPDARLITDVVTADVSNATATPAKITTLDQTLGVGTYQFKYMIRYQSALTTTGVRFSVNHTGTVAFFVATVRWTDASATASTAAPDQDNVQAAGAVTGSFAARAKSTTGWGTTISVDAANSDMLIIIEGTMEVTGSGNIELYHGSEVAAASTVKAGTNLVITKVN
jgi:hypothetical protein